MTTTHPLKMRIAIGVAVVALAGLLSTTAIAAPGPPTLAAPTPAAPAQPAPTPVAAAPAPAPVTAAGCTFPALTQPFGSVGDTNSYFLAPGANFESGTNGWTMSGGASLVAGNETLLPESASSSHSLAIPSTSASATTPAFCVTTNAPTFRMFIKNSGSLGHIDGQLAIYLNFTGADGKPQQVKIAGLTVNSTAWTLTPPISFIQYLSTPLKSGYANISFTIDANDNHGNWLIDDLYVDPFCSR